MRWLSGFLTVLFLGLASVTLVAAPAMAQQSAANAPDYSEWEVVATRAEKAVDTARASDAALTALRAQIADWRSQFQDQLSGNDSRIATLRDQLTALGDPPAEGALKRGTRDRPAAHRVERSADSSDHATTLCRRGVEPRQWHHFAN